jgi:hypothetical protein
MKIKKLMLLTIVIVSGIFLSSCKDESEGFTVTLLNNGEVYKEYTDLVDGDQLDFDKMFLDDMIFVGWKDQNNFYLSDYVVTSDTTLTATFEDPNDVFEVNQDFNLEDGVSLQNYTGESSIVVLPNQINDQYILTIGDMNTSGSSNISELYLTVDTVITMSAFENDTTIKKVEYYSEPVYEIERTSVITQDEYDDILLEDSCTVKEDTATETSWEFIDGCSIDEVTNVMKVVVAGTEYFNYEVLIKETKVEYHYSMISSYAFANATSLEQVVFPEPRFFENSIFLGCSSLISVSFLDESEHYQSLEDGIYSKEGDILLLYFGGLTSDRYEIRESVREVSYGAFSGAQNIETLVIPDTFTNSFLSDGLQNLKAFEVSNTHPSYQSIDGVLYMGESLLRYPVSKEGTSYEIIQGTTTIKSGAFYGNLYLEEIIIPSNVTFIEDYAFMRTVSLTSITFPTSLESYGMNLFRESSVSEVTFLRSSVIDGSITSSIFGLGLSVENPIIYVPNDSYTEYYNALLEKNGDIIESIVEN